MTVYFNIVFASDSTSCSRPEDTICKRRRQDWCKYEVVRKQCPRKCGVCGKIVN